MLINIEPLVFEKLGDLLKALLEGGYYATEASAEKYVQAIIDFIYSLPTRTARKTRNKRYGEFYITYRPNRRTTWYVTFDEYREKYIVRNVVNNHSKEYAKFIAAVK